MTIIGKSIIIMMMAYICAALTLSVWEMISELPKKVKDIIDKVLVILAIFAGIAAVTTIVSLAAFACGLCSFAITRAALAALFEAFVMMYITSSVTLFE